MLNLRALLTKICQSIYELTTWVTNMDSTIESYSHCGEEISSTRSTAISVPSSTSGGTNIVSLSIPPGLWIIQCRIRFPNTSGGYRRACYSTTSATVGSTGPIETPVVSGTSMMTFSVIGEYTTTTTGYLVALQNSGSAISVSDASMSAIRVI